LLDELVTFIRGGGFTRLTDESVAKKMVGGVGDVDSALLTELLHLDSGGDTGPPDVKMRAHVAKVATSGDASMHANTHANVGVGFGGFATDDVLHAHADEYDALCGVAERVWVCGVLLRESSCTEDIGIADGLDLIDGVLVA